MRKMPASATAPVNSILSPKLLGPSFDNVPPAWVTAIAFVRFRRLSPLPAVGDAEKSNVPPSSVIVPEPKLTLAAAPVAWLNCQSSVPLSTTVPPVKLGEAVFRYSNVEPPILVSPAPLAPVRVPDSVNVLLASVRMRFLLNVTLPERMGLPLLSGLPSVASPLLPA